VLGVDGVSGLAGELGEGGAFGDAGEFGVAVSASDVVRGVRGLRGSRGLRSLRGVLGVLGCRAALSDGNWLPWSPHVVLPSIGHSLVIVAAFQVRSASADNSDGRVWATLLGSVGNLAGEAVGQTPRGNSCCEELAKADTSRSAFGVELSKGRIGDARACMRPFVPGTTVGTTAKLTSLNPRVISGV
jgi:hypothetical protein